MKNCLTPRGDAIEFLIRHWIVRLWARYDAAVPGRVSNRVRGRRTGEFPEYPQRTRESTPFQECFRAAEIYLDCGLSQTPSFPLIDDAARRN